MGQFLPVVSAVNTLVDPGSLAATFQRIRRAQDAPETGIQDSRIRRIHRKINGTNLVVDIEDAFPGYTAIARTVNAALLVRTEQVSHNGGIHEIRVLRMYPDAGNML